MTEDEIVQIIDIIAKRLARRFKFGYHEVQDIEQQARLIAWEGMANYDGVRPLENYLWVHVKNRLCNFKRDNFIRPNSPCDKCMFFQHSCTKHDNEKECDIYEKWVAATVAKLNIVYPIGFSCVDDYNEDNMSESIVSGDIAVGNELKVLIDKYLPVEFRHFYVKFLNGYKLLPQQKNALLGELRNIIEKYYSGGDDGS